jgi:hypothetical protein
MLATIAAAPAAAADPIGEVRINDMLARQCGTDSSGRVQYCVGSAPLVTIAPPSHPDNENAQARRMGVFNDERAPGGEGTDQITGVIAESAPQGGGSGGWFQGAFEYYDSFGSSVGCQPPDGPRISCFPYWTYGPEGGVYPPAMFIRWVASDRDNHAGLQSVDVEFNFGDAISPCAGPAAPGGGSAAASARVAGACTPPSHTKITTAKIHRNTAFFRFTARHATSFECALLRNKRIMFRHSCHSPKPYANSLPHGHYEFVVTGVNHAGIDRKSAIKKFTIN